MKDKMGHFRQLRQQSVKYREEDQRRREAEQTGSKPETETNSPNKLDREKRNFDHEFRAREEEKSKLIADRKMDELKMEIRLMNEAKSTQMKEEMESLQQENTKKEIEINRLGNEFTNFDKLADEKVGMKLFWISQFLVPQILPKKFNTNLTHKN